MLKTVWDEVERMGRCDERGWLENLEEARELLEFCGGEWLMSYAEPVTPRVLER